MLPAPRLTSSLTTVPLALSFPSWCRLKLPAVVERDDPLLFLGDDEFVDVVEQLMGVDPGEAAQAFTGEWVGGWGSMWCLASLQDCAILYALVAACLLTVLRARAFPACLPTSLLHVLRLLPLQTTTTCCAATRAPLRCLPA